MLETEAQVLRTLRTGTYTLEELYRLCEQNTDVNRGRGQDPPTPKHPGDKVWRRRVRGCLQNLRAAGRAHRIEKACWALQGAPEQPRALLLILPNAERGQVELYLKDAARLLRQLDEPCDLILCDPPYGLRWDGPGSPGRRGFYGRREDLIVPGYVDIHPDLYITWTHEWVAAAAGALREGGQLVAITGPQRAAQVQLAAEDSGLRWLASIAARRTFPLWCTRKPSPAHWTITVLCRGAANHPSRVFNAPEDLPRSQTSSRAYPTDWWEKNGRSDRPGRMRYANSLPPRLVRRLVRTFSDPGELVCDPCLGGGETAIQAWLHGRRFVGGDINPEALRYTAARLLAEHAWTAQAQPRLFDEAHGDAASGGEPNANGDASAADADDCRL